MQQEHLQVSDALGSVQGEHVALRNDLDLLQTHTAMLSKDGKVLLISDAQLVQGFGQQGASAVRPTVLAWYDSYMQSNPRNLNLREHLETAATYAPKFA